MLLNVWQWKVRKPQEGSSFMFGNDKSTLLVRPGSRVLELVEAGGLTMCCTVVLEDRGGKWHLQEDWLCPRSLSLFLCLVEGCEMKGWSL